MFCVCINQWYDGFAVYVHLRGWYQAAALGEKDGLQQPGDMDNNSMRSRDVGLDGIIFSFFPRNRGSFKRVRRWPRAKKKEKLSALDFCWGERG